MPDESLDSEARDLLRASRTDAIEDRGSAIFRLLYRHSYSALPEGTSYDEFRRVFDSEGVGLDEAGVAVWKAIHLPAIVNAVDRFAKTVAQPLLLSPDRTEELRSRLRALLADFDGPSLG